MPWTALPGPIQCMSEMVGSSSSLLPRLPSLSAKILSGLELTLTLTLTQLALILGLGLRSTMALNSQRTPNYTRVVHI